MSGEEYIRPEYDQREISGSQRKPSLSHVSTSAAVRSTSIIKSGGAKHSKHDKTSPGAEHAVLVRYRPTRASTAYRTSYVFSNVRLWVFVDVFVYERNNS